jgi:lysophospholipid acyltransferase (LPLAT)-like uncharacterized protein
MKLTNPRVARFGGWLLSQFLENWMSTLCFRMASYEKGNDPSESDFKGPAIFLLWHEYIPFPFYLRPRCHMALLISQHGDAELLSQAARFRGLNTVRGSSTRGGVTAIKKLLDDESRTSLCITPDGPKGPRRQLALGAIFLASKLGFPLIPLGFGYDRPWRNTRAWDHFAIPRPGSRARAVIGPKLYVPNDLERDELEQWRQHIETALNQVTTEAEQWATDNLPREKQQSLFVSTAQPPRIPLTLPLPCAGTVKPYKPVAEVSDSKPAN